MLHCVKSHSTDKICIFMQMHNNKNTILTISLHSSLQALLCDMQIIISLLVMKKEQAFYANTKLLENLV